MILDFFFSTRFISISIEPTKLYFCFLNTRSQCTPIVNIAHHSFCLFEVLNFVLGSHVFIQSSIIVLFLGACYHEFVNFMTNKIYGCYSYPLGEFLGSMLPQYMALSVSFVSFVLFVWPLLSKLYICFS